jgi:prepilin-type N-terminal cleavage/methylation domain-containing protein
MSKEKRQIFNCSCRSQKELKSGFTLLEIIITMSIVLLISSLTAFGYVKFNDRLENTSLAFEVALLLREAQISGVSVRENPDAGTFENAWGVYTKIGGSGNSDSRVVLFVDSDSDEIYDGNFDNCPSQECVSSLDMRRNNVLGKVCRLTTGGGSVCYPESEDLAGFSVTFKRPKPDAKLTFIDLNGAALPEEPNVIGAQICIRSPLDRLAAVEVLKTGEISVKKECES